MSTHKKKLCHATFHVNLWWNFSGCCTFLPGTNLFYQILFLLYLTAGKHDT
jgi:hypothetical protein